jgi:hypothetical protein
MSRPLVEGEVEVLRGNALPGTATGTESVLILRNANFV